MNIFPASINDVEEVISWIATEDECRLWAGPAVSYPIRIGHLLDEISFSPGNSFSCKSELGLLGFGQILRKDNGRSHLARIISNPTCRGQGYGHTICRYLTDYASQLGSDSVSLNVYRENTRALRLYESLGYREQAEKSDGTNIFMLRT